MYYCHLKKKEGGKERHGQLSELNQFHLHHFKPSEWPCASESCFLFSSPCSLNFHPCGPTCWCATFINWEAKRIPSSPAESFNPFSFQTTAKMGATEWGSETLWMDIKMGHSFLFVSFPHPDRALRAACRHLLGYKVVSPMLRGALASSSVVLRQWKWVWLFCSFKSPPRLRSLQQRGVTPQCVSHTWMSCWLSFDSQIGRFFLPSTKKQTRRVFRRSSKFDSEWWVALLSHSELWGPVM